MVRPTHSQPVKARSDYSNSAATSKNRKIQIKSNALHQLLVVAELLQSERALRQIILIIIQPNFNLHHFSICRQCDQIWRFIGLLASFQSQWQQLICPNLPHSQATFCKGVEIFHFSSEIILGNFYRHLAIFFWSHCLQGKRVIILYSSFFWKTCAKNGNNSLHTCDLNF